jgi:hypothetical protein
LSLGALLLLPFADTSAVDPGVPICSVMVAACTTRRCIIALADKLYGGSREENGIEEGTTDILWKGGEFWGSRPAHGQTNSRGLQLSFIAPQIGIIISLVARDNS